MKDARATFAERHQDGLVGRAMIFHAVIGSVLATAPREYEKVGVALEARESLGADEIAVERDAGGRSKLEKKFRGAWL
jgi:hypothetical protein